MRNPIVKISVPSTPPVVTVPVPVPPVIKLAGGVRGKDGTPGVGVPAGGTTRQALVKASDADFDTEFETLRELPTTPTGNPAAYGGEYVLTTNAGTPPAWEARGQIPVPGAPGPEGAVHHLSWQRNTPGPAWITTAHVPYIGLGTGLPRHTLIVGDGGSYRWVQEDPIPALPDESGQFLGVQDGALAWLHPIPPAIAGTDPQTLTIPANTPTEVAKNLCPNPTAVAGGAPVGLSGGAAWSATQGATIPATENGTTTAVMAENVSSPTWIAALSNADGLLNSTTMRTVTMVVGNPNAFDIQVSIRTSTQGNIFTTIPAGQTRTISRTGINFGLLFYAQRTNGTAAAGDKIWYTEITTADEFFTGDTPPTPTTTYQWDGPPHNSPSTKYAIDTTTQWTPITLIPPPPPTGTWTLTTTNGTITWEQTP